MPTVKFRKYGNRRGKLPTRKAVAIFCCFSYLIFSPCTFSKWLFILHVPFSILLPFTHYKHLYFSVWLQILSNFGSSCVTVSCVAEPHNLLNPIPNTGYSGFLGMQGILVLYCSYKSEKENLGRGMYCSHILTTNPGKVVRKNKNLFPPCWFILYFFVY